MSKVNYRGYEMSQNLKTLIEHSIKDGKITKKEKEAIYKRAEIDDITEVEMDILLNSLIFDIKKDRKTARIETLNKGISFLTKKDKKGDSNLMLFIIVPIIVIGLGIFVYSIATRGQENSKQVVLAINDYDFETARTYLSNLQSSLGGTSQSDREQEEKYKKLALQLYNAEEDYYLTNKSYQLAFQTTNDLYQLLNSYAFYDESSEANWYNGKKDTYDREQVIEIYYVPLMSRFINALVNDGKKDEAIQYVNSISDLKTKDYMLNEINRAFKK